MIIEKKIYVCDRTPKDEDIIEAMKVVEKENVAVELQWFINYSGLYRVYIDKDSTLESVKENLPKYYGV